MASDSTTAGDVADNKAQRSPAANIARHCTMPMTPLQRKYLLEKMRHTKRVKHSIQFIRPVDTVALNIPTYHEIVKWPMDLNTMEAKLKDKQYDSVQEFADDFDLIVSNCTLFNGPRHAVTFQA